MLNGPAAPSPAIPTYRPSRQIPKIPIMPTVALTDSKKYIRIPGLRKPRPRSAGASSRPMRSENIAELVRFFQAEEEIEEEEEEEESRVSFQTSRNMDIFKAGQRRLKHMGQPKSERTTSSKDSDTSSLSEKRSAQRQHLMALQREGLLPGLGEHTKKPHPSRTKPVKEDLGEFLPSLEALSDKSRPSRTKEDVEAIGRPWLDDALASISTGEDRSTSQIELPLHGLRNESLNLGDLAALVDFSVSFPDLYSHDRDPPPSYQAQAQAQSHPQPESQSQIQASSFSESAATNRGAHNGNPATRQLENSNGSHSSSLRTQRETPASNNPAPGHHGTGDIPRQPQYKLDKDKNDEDSCCESNCDCDDAKSLAVLLRATQRLGGEKNRTSQNPPSGYYYSSALAATKAFTSATTTSTNPMAASTPADSRKSNLASHSLNQGVTDTPLFVRNLVENELENKLDGPEAAQKINNKTPRGADQLSPLSPQASFSPTSHLNAGPIPLKLVAECMPPVVSKPISPQPLNAFAPRPRSNLTGEMTLLQPPSTTVGQSSTTLPRTRALLSPIPIQPRRSRSVTPDVASDSQKNVKKKGKKAPLYVITDAPLPPPARPLPSLPQSAGVVPGHRPVQGDRTVSTPAQPSSAPLEYRMEDRDSPVLGMNSHKLKLQKSLVRSRPPSHYSNRSVDLSDGHSSRTASPAVSLAESRRGRSDQVRALRMRDIDAKKRREVSETNAHLGSTKRADSIHTQSDSQGHNDRRKLSRRNRISAVPEFPLPKNPPVNAQGTPNVRRRRSTTSLPGSISTMNGYEGGLSRSVSVTSGSIDSFPIRHGKVAHAPRDTAKNLVPRNPEPESPLLPSSDDERLIPKTRRSKHNVVPEETGDFKTRQGNHGKSKQSTIKEKALLKHAQYSSPSEISQYAPFPGSESQTNFIHLLRHLESRVVTLERQNKMLQAALLAALDVGVSHDADSAQSRSTSPALSSMRVPTISERSMPSYSNLGIGGARQKQGKTAQRHNAPRAVYTHDGISAGSRGSFETTSSHSDSSVRPADGLPTDRQ